MGKHIFGVVVGLMVWLAAAMAAGVLLRSVWPEDVAASGDMSFTLPMKLTRLSIGALTTFAAGVVSASHRAIAMDGGGHGRAPALDLHPRAHQPLEQVSESGIT